MAYNIEKLTEIKGYYTVVDSKEDVSDINDKKNKENNIVYHDLMLIKKNNDETKRDIEYYSIDNLSIAFNKEKNKTLIENTTTDITVPHITTKEHKKILYMPNDLLLFYKNSKDYEGYEKFFKQYPDAKSAIFLNGSFSVGSKDKTLYVYPSKTKTIKPKEEIFNYVNGIYKEEISVKEAFARYKHIVEDDYVSKSKEIENNSLDEKDKLFLQLLDNMQIFYQFKKQLPYFEKGFFSLEDEEIIYNTNIKKMINYLLLISDFNSSATTEEVEKLKSFSIDKNKMNIFYNEILKRLFTNKKETILFEDAGSDELEIANAIIDRIDKDKIISKNFFNYISLVAKISFSDKLQDIGKIINEYVKNDYKKVEDGKIDFSLLKNGSNKIYYEALEDIIEKIKNKKLIEVNSIDTKKMISINDEFEIASLKIDCNYLSRYTTKTILVQKTDSLDEVEELYKKLIADFPYSFTIPLKIYKDNFKNEYLFLGDKGCEVVLDEEQKQVKIFGIRGRTMSTETSSFMLRGKPKKSVFDINLKRIISNHSNEAFSYNIRRISKHDDMEKFFKKYSSFKDYYIARIQNIEDKLSHALLAIKQASAKNPITMFSELNNIGIREAKFPNPTLISNIYSNTNVSVVDIVSSPLMANALSFYPALYQIVKNIAEKARLKMPKNTNLIIKPTEGTKSIPQHLKKESISGHKNLGMIKYSYLPILNIQSKEDKEFLYSILVKEFGKLQDADILKENIDKSNYVVYLTEKELDDNTIKSNPAICLLDNENNNITKLSLTVYQWEKLLIDNKILDYKDIIKNPSLTLKIQQKIIFGVGGLLNEAYSKILTKETTAQMRKIYFSYAKNNDEEYKDKMIEVLKKYFFAHFVKHRVINKNLKDVENKIKQLAIPPFEKSALMRTITKVENLFNDTEINKTLINYEKYSSEIFEEISSIIDEVKKNINDNLKKANDETISFIYYCKLFDIAMKLKNTKSKDEYRELLKVGYSTIKEWASNGLGLFKEQVDTSLNAIILSEKKEDISFYIFHSMGTGKTRLALFLQMLYHAVNPKEDAMFAIQNSNQNDILTQLKDMLPSLYIMTNKIFSNSSANKDANTQIPLSLVEYVYPNIFTGTTHNIFNNITAENSKKLLGKDYPKEIESIMKWMDNNDYYEYFEKNCNPELVKILKNLKQIYKTEILDKILVLGSKIKRNEMDKFYKKAEKSFIATVFYIENKSKEGYITIDEENTKSISKKIEQVYTAYFDSIYKEKQSSSKNSLSIMANRVFDMIPDKKTEEFKKIIDKDNPDFKKKNSILTNGDVVKISAFNIPKHSPVADILMEDLTTKLYEMYKPKKTDLEIWLFSEFLTDSNVINEIKTDFNKAFRLNLLIDKKDDFDLLSFNDKDVFALFNTITQEIKEEYIYPSTCPSITNDSSPIACECINANSLLSNKKEFEDVCNNILKAYNESEAKNNEANPQPLIEYFKEIYNQPSKLSEIINKYFFLKVLSDVLNPNKNFKNKIKKCSLFTCTASEADLSFKTVLEKGKSSFVAPAYYFGYIKEKTGSGSLLYSFYEKSTAKVMKKNKPDFEEKEVVGDAIDINYKGLGSFEAKLYFDDIEDKQVFKINYSTSYLYVPIRYNEKNKNKPIVITDEAHKKGNKPAEAVLENGCVPVFLTGTPTGGKPEDVASTLFPSIKDDMQRKTIGSLLKTNGGMTKIENPFLLVLITIPDVRNDIINFISKAEKLGWEKDSFVKTVALIKKKYQSELKILKNSVLEKRDKIASGHSNIDIIGDMQKIEMLEKFSEENIFNIVDFMLKISKVLKFTKVENSDYLKIIYLAAGAEDFVDYPGFSNPLAVGHIIRETGGNKHLEISIKDGEGRAYHFHDLENAVKGTIPPLPHDEVIKKITENHLETPIILYKALKNLKQTQQYLILSKLFETIENKIVYSKNEKLRNFFFDKFKEEAISDENSTIFMSTIKNYKALIKEISTHSVADNDSLLYIFRDKVGSKESLKWNKASEHKKIAIKTICRIINDFYSYKNNGDKKILEDLKKVFGDIMPAYRILNDVMSELHDLYEQFNTYINIDEIRGYQKIKERDKKSKKIISMATIPLFKDLTINLQNHFLNVFSDKDIPIPLTFRLLQGKENEVLSEMFTNCDRLVFDNFNNDKNSLVLTTRISILQLKTIEILEKMLQFKDNKKPFYLLVNAPSETNFQIMINNFDKNKLADKNIFVINSNVQSLYADYNNLPKDASFAIISNYESIAEGFRFPRVHENIIAGQTKKIATALQAISRVFFPRKVFDSNITLVGQKSFPLLEGEGEAKSYIKNDMIAIEKITINVLIDYIEKSKIKELSSSVYSKIIDDIPDISKRTDIRNATIAVMPDVALVYARISESLKAALNFMAAKIEGVKEEKPTKFINKNIREKTEEAVKTKYTKKY